MIEKIKMKTALLLILIISALSEILTAQNSAYAMELFQLNSSVADSNDFVVKWTDGFDDHKKASPFLELDNCIGWVGINVKGIYMLIEVKMNIM